MQRADKTTQLLHYDESYYKKIMANIDRLGEAERKAAAYIVEHGAVCARMSVGQLADACGCSPASIVRLCKDLGYSGFSELKFNIQQSSSDVAGNNLSILQTDSMEEVVEKTFHFTQRSMNSVVRLLDMQGLERASKAIAKANLVLFCAMGSACGAAVAGANHLMSAGINATFQMDELLLMRTASYLGPDDVVIGINYDGNSKNVVDTLKIGQKNGATTVLLTSIPNSLGTKYSDIVLLTPKRSTNSDVNYSTTTLCQIMLVHLLLVGAWQKAGESLQEKAQEMRALTHIKRYSLDTSSVDIKPVKQ